MNIFKDRYFLFCVSVALVIMISSVVMESETPEDIIGIVYDVNETAKGYVFSIEDSEGNVMRCFSYEMPEEFSVCEVNGSFSDDENIFFISNISVATLG